MKLFIDTANISEIGEAASWGILDGVTTNPSLVAREGRSYHELVAEICRQVACLDPAEDELVDLGPPFGTLEALVAATAAMTGLKLRAVRR